MRGEVFVRRLEAFGDIVVGFSLALLALSLRCLARIYRIAATVPVMIAGIIVGARGDAGAMAMVVSISLVIGLVSCIRKSRSGPGHSGPRRHGRSLVSVSVR